MSDRPDASGSNPHSTEDGTPKLLQPTPREKFIAGQRRLLDEMFALTSDEGKLRDSFEKLALETYDHLTAAGLFGYYYGPDNILLEQEIVRAHMSPDLMRRWRDWREQYRGLLERNPRLLLYDMMVQMGVSHSESKWPYDLEIAIQDWIDKGERLPIPFSDRYDIVTPEFYMRLREARRRAGGFLLWIEETRSIVFLPEPEWQAHRAVEERRAAEARRKSEEAQAGKARLRALEAAIIHMARADERFWRALRDWELAREAKRPPEVKQTPWRDPDRQENRIIVVVRRPMGLSPEQLERLENPPIDPLFVDFLAKVQAFADSTDGTADLMPYIHGRFWGRFDAADGTTARRLVRIVTLVREEMRKELGLDAALGWPGGPSLAET